MSYRQKYGLYGDLILIFKNSQIPIIKSKTFTCDVYSTVYVRLTFPCIIKAETVYVTGQLKMKEKQKNEKVINAI